MTIINMSGGRAGKPPVYQARTVQPTAFPTTVQPQQGYDALSQVTVNAPANLLAQNIRKDVNIAGVVGTYEAIAPTISLQQKTVTPTASPQLVTPDEGYDGLSQVQVTGSAYLGPANIKKGVTIFGVTGTYTGDSSMRSGTWEYAFKPSGPTFPMILGTRSVGIRENYTSFQGNGTCLMGNRVNYACTASSFRCWGADPMTSVWFIISDLNEFEQLDTPSFTGSLRTNRDTSTMDSFLGQVSDLIKDDYFSGTLTCRLWWIGENSSSWQSAISAGSMTTKGVPFTYSNGNVTYTIPDLTYNLGMFVRKADNITRGYPALFFEGLSLNL